jgi:CRP/FNR family transcriptional regulator, cyclic AMP receptor protein
MTRDAPCASRVPPALACSPLFDRLPRDDVAALLPSFDYLSLPRGTQIFAQGDTDNGMLYVVLSGHVLLLRQVGGAPRRIVAFHGPSSMLGELSVFDPGRRESTAIVARPAQIARVNRRDLRAWMRTCPAAADHLLQVMARRLRTANDLHVDLVQVDAQTRIARILLHLARQMGVAIDGGIAVPHGLTQAQLAAYAGTSRESFNRALRVFAARGWLVAQRRAVVLLDRHALWSCAGRPSSLQLG